VTESKGIARQEAEFLLYQTEDGNTRIDVRFDGETAWLSLSQLAELFQRDKSVISRHIKNVFDEGELSRGSTVAKFATVQREGDREVTREVEYFNLDVIISHVEELEALNRIVNAYLEFAEVQALAHKPMYMADWIAKLDDFLRLSERKILDHAGKVTHEAAVAKAELEYDRFAQARAALPSPVEKHFEEAMSIAELLKDIQPSKSKRGKKR
jgi:hypothetical protein